MKHLYAVVEWFGYEGADAPKAIFTDQERANKFCAKLNMPAKDAMQRGYQTGVNYDVHTVPFDPTDEELEKL